MTTGINKPGLGHAIALMSVVFKDTTDKGGHAYALHCIRVMQRLRTTDEDLMIIAVLHDVIEDSTYTIDHLRDMGYSERVLAALMLLTRDHKDNSDVSYQRYIERIATNEDATRVKMEDLRDNSDITRLKGLRQKDFARLEKYHRAFLFLQKSREIRMACW